MEILIIIGLILLNGIFSMAEMSLVSARKFKLESGIKKGVSGAKAALELSENPTKFLSTVQIGITLIGILLGVYSGEKLTSDVSNYLSKYELIRPYANNIAVGVIVVFVTYLSIVLGELFPKRLAMTFPEPIAIFLSKPMKILSKITSPFVWLLTKTNDMLLRILGIKKVRAGKVSEEEIKSIIRESAEGGEIADIEQNIVERVFELGDRKVNSLFTHRSEIIYFDLGASWEEIRTKINEYKHSAYPVCKEDDLDKVAGIVLLKDLFVPGIEKDFELKNFIKTPIFLNETANAYKVLELFKDQKMHYGIIVDEYGSTVGIVTMDDVVDALVGDVTEHDQEEYQIVQRDAQSWLVDGQYPVMAFIKYFAINLDEEIDGSFNTVAGLFMHVYNELPAVGVKIILDNFQLEVIDKDGQRIDKIMVSRIIQ